MMGYMNMLRYKNKKELILVIDLIKKTQNIQYLVSELRTQVPLFKQVSFKQGSVLISQFFPVKPLGQVQL